MLLDMYGDLRRNYERDGFALLENLFTEDEVQAMKNECLNIAKSIPEDEKKAVFSTVDSESNQNREKYLLESADRISFFYEKDSFDSNGELSKPPELSLNKIGHAMHLLNPIFKKYTFDERIKEACYQLGFVDPAVVQSMYIFKNPGIGGEVTEHQDITYLHTDPEKLVGFWIALDDATLDNGCLWIAKESHKSGVHRRYIRNPDKDSDELLIYTGPNPHYQRSTFTPVPVKKGTCVLIHGQVVHFSEANKSEESRHAYTFHVIEQRNTKYSNNNWLQLPDGKSFANLYKTFA